MSPGLFPLTTKLHAPVVAGAAVSTAEVAPINGAQAQAQQAMLSAGAGARLARLARADLLETLLLAAARVIKADAAYVQATSRQAREAFLGLHLQLAIVQWVRAAVQTPAEAVALDCAERVIQGAHLAG